MFPSVSLSVYRLRVRRSVCVNMCGSTCVNVRGLRTITNYQSLKFYNIPDSLLSRQVLKKYYWSLRQHSCDSNKPIRGRDYLRKTYINLKWKDMPHYWFPPHSNKIICRDGQCLSDREVISTCVFIYLPFFNSSILYLFS